MLIPLMLLLHFLLAAAPFRVRLNRTRESHMPGDPLIQCHPYPLLLMECNCCWSEEARGPNQLANHAVKRLRIMFSVKRYR
uniref:Putative secreted peptide n=1 Tax=Anopheles braziliensis TaxID=58242 RepID=A0A2M3ZWB1_9DIPT